MNPWGTMARMLIAGGALLLIVGLAILAFDKLGPNWRLPGDIFFRRGNVAFFFPLATCILLSIILSILLNYFIKR